MLIAYSIEVVLNLYVQFSRNSHLDQEEEIFCHLFMAIFVSLASVFKISSYSLTNF